MLKNSSAKELAVAKSNYPKKSPILKKWLLSRNCNCCVKIVTLKKCIKVVSPKTNLS